MKLTNNKIYLEKSGYHLIWGSSLAELIKLNPIKVVQNDRTILIWQHEQVLNGIEGDIEIIFWNDESKPFSKIEITYLKEPQYKFELLSNHLKKYFGDPIQIIDDGKYDRFWKWQIDQITIFISLFEMHQLKCILNISKS